MNNLRWMVLGYFMCFLINGCDLGIGSDEENFNSTLSNGLGSSQWNPVYVKVVD